MKALIFKGTEKVATETLADPCIETPTDAIVKVACSAICGSDLHPYFGRELGLEHGTVMGHEFAGEIVETGKQVRHFRKGQRVTCPFTTSCGACFYCLAGLTCRCTYGQLFGWVQDGVGLQGGQAQFVRVPMADSSLFELPESLDYQTGLFLGDILPTGYFAAQGADITRTGTYAVVGCGPVGLMGILSAFELGAQRVFALDRVPRRLQAAESFGAIPVHVDKEDAIAVLQSATQNRGADGVLEMVGQPSAARLAYDLVRPGGTISVVGFHSEAQLAFSPTEAYDKNLTYKVGRCPARAYMERLLPVAVRASSQLREVISHRLPLDQAQLGYRLFAGHLENCTKVLLLS